MKLMVLKPFQLNTKGGPKLYQPGDVFESHSPKAALYIQEGYFKPIEDAKFPILPGWVVAYRGKDGRVDGGTINECKAINGGWIVTLGDGRNLKENEILSVAKIENGQWIEAWTVRGWGLDGNRKGGK